MTTSDPIKPVLEEKIIPVLEAVAPVLARVAPVLLTLAEMAPIVKRLEEQVIAMKQNQSDLRSRIAWTNDSITKLLDRSTAMDEKLNRLLAPKKQLHIQSG